MSADEDDEEEEDKEGEEEGEGEQAGESAGGEMISTSDSSDSVIAAAAAADMRERVAILSAGALPFLLGGWTAQSRNSR